MKKKKILVVEDEVLDELLYDILKELNHELYYAKNAKEALNFVDENHPDLILLNIMLPGQSGYNICSILKNNPISKDIPIIFISALDSEKHIAKGLKLGAADYITKPLKKSLVTARVENQLKLNEFQKELKTKHKQQNILLENIDTQIWYLKDKYTYGKVNSSHAEFLGVCKEDIENKRFDSFLEEELADLCEKSNEEVFAKKTKIITEEWASDHKGNKRLLRISKNPVFDDSGNIEYVVASAEDITEEKQKENRLKKTNNRLKMISKKLETIFDNIQSLVFLVDIDNGKFTYDRVNSNFEDYLAMSIQDIHGRTPRELFGDEFGSGIEEHYRICYEEKSSLAYEETTVLGGDKRIWLTKISPIIIDEEVKQLVGTSVDITENKKRENKILDQKNKLENILKTTMDGFFIADENGNFITANKSFVDIIGYNEDELLNLAIHDIEVKENEVEVKKHLKKIKSKGSDRFETVLKTKSDKNINVEISVTDLGFQDNSNIFFAFVRDITERHKRQKEINTIKERLELAVEGGNIGVWDWNIKSKEVHYNNHWAKMIGYEEEELDYHISSWQNLVHPDDIEEVNAEVKKLLEDKKETYKIEQRLKTKKGSWKWIRDIGKVTERDDDGNPVRAVGVHIDIDKEKRAQKRIKYLSNHDSLTGLYNNRYFNEEIKRLINSRQYPISLIIGDLDNLKTVNDNYGHQIGDYYIKQTADILKNLFRNEDVVSRIGGDEFAVILPNTDEKTALEMCSRVENKFEEIRIDDSNLDLLSISLGSFTMKNNYYTFLEAYRIADNRMYQNKNIKTKNS